MLTVAQVGDVCTTSGRLIMDIRSLGYVIIESTDLAKWATFATEILGMMRAPGMPDNDRLYLKMDAFPFRLMIVPGDHDRFLRPGWQLPTKAAFRQALQQLEEAGIHYSAGSVEEAEARRVGEFVDLTAPGGLQLELFYNIDLDYEPLLSPVGIKEFVTGYHGDMGLGHIAVQTPTLEQSHDFFTSVMGFGQTDYMHFHFDNDADQSGHGLHFLHCNNPRHHSLALYESDEAAPGDLVHLMIEVPTIDDLGFMMDRVKAHGVAVVTPLGRHTNDRMISLYVESPAGFAVEFGCGGVQIDWRTYTPTMSAKPSVWGHHWDT